MRAMRLQYGINTVAIPIRNQRATLSEVPQEGLHQVTFTTRARGITQLLYTR